MPAHFTHPLEEFTCKVFGDRFAGLMLLGYRKRYGYKSIHFTIGEEKNNNVKIEVTISLSYTRSPTYSQKPLVLAALLKLLLKQKGDNHVLTFTHEDILTELRWPDTLASQKRIDEAIQFYITLAYTSEQQFKFKKNPSLKLTSVHQLLTQHQMQNTWRPQSLHQRRVRHSVTFCPLFVRSLRKSQINFAEIHFGRIDAGELDIRLNKHSNEDSQEVRAKRKDPRPNISREVNPITKPLQTHATVRINFQAIEKSAEDYRLKINSRPEGSMRVLIDTGAIASTIMRALQRGSDPSTMNPWTVYMSEEVAEGIFREIEEKLLREIIAAVKLIRREVFENAKRKTHGWMHHEKASREQGKRKSESRWSSAEHMQIALLRAIDAIEENGWKPKKVPVIINKRWNLRHVKTATLPMVLAYWKEEEGLNIGNIDYSQMKKWLDALELPSFSNLRELLRERISKRKENERLAKIYSTIDLHKIILESFAASLISPVRSIR